MGLIVQIAIDRLYYAGFRAYSEEKKAELMETDDTKSLMSLKDFSDTESFLASLTSQIAVTQNLMMAL